MSGRDHSPPPPAGPTRSEEPPAPDDRPAGDSAEPPAVSLAEPRRGLSLAVRLLAAFLALAAVFGGIVGWGLHRSRMALEEVRLLDEGYLRLALSTAELRATQSILLTLLERILDEPDPANTRSWVETVRRLRPERLARLTETVARIRTLAPGDEDVAAADRLATDLGRLDEDARAGDAALDRFFGDLDGGRLEQARATLEAALERERAVDRGLRAAGREADRQVADLSAALQHDEARTFWMLLGLALVAAGIAIGILVFVHSTLAPLRALERAVQAVARGDLSGRIDVRRRDEIGRLAAQFDRMTLAIRERDERLRTLRQGEKLAALGRMAAHVTHEVRNPLSAIGLNTELLQEELERAGAADATRGMVQTIAREVERLTRVTQSYLSLARTPRLEIAPTDVGRLARETVDFHQAEAEASGARLECEVQGEPPALRADAGRLRQVLANLLRNALEAVEGRPERLVRVVVRPLRDGVELAVTDSGPGLSDEARSRLFEPFFTTKRQGTGIGLAESQQIAAAHQGTLTCDPDPGPGAVFRLWIPGEAAAADAARPAKA
ncbi:MAG: HAMP domain-containing protein [Deltaproteobacteria bacterium]|nr:HAMP domain-containing protein [Deltaproteobacteria bacterium]